MPILNPIVINGSQYLFGIFGSLWVHQSCRVLYLWLLIFPPAPSITASFVSFIEGSLISGRETYMIWISKFSEKKMKHGLPGRRWVEMMASELWKMGERGWLYWGICCESHRNHRHAGSSVPVVVGSTFRAGGQTTSLCLRGIVGGSGKNMVWDNT